jgi:hypothetical protein
MRRIYYDIHLSAEVIASTTIVHLEKLGMHEDFLREHRLSVPPHYHGTHRKHLPSLGGEWEQVVDILRADASFRGTLEGEQNDTQWQTFYGGTGKLDRLPMRPFVLEQCKPGEHKACDIHLRVDPRFSTDPAVRALETCGFIYFKRKAPDVDYLIFTLTFEELRVGEYVFEKLHDKLAALNGLVGRMKLEVAEKYWVHPDDATQLPIVRTTFAQEWLAQ